MMSYVHSSTVCYQNYGLTGMVLKACNRCARLKYKCSHAKSGIPVQAGRDSGNKANMLPPPKGRLRRTRSLPQHCATVDQGKIVHSMYTVCLLFEKCSQMMHPPLHRLISLILGSYCSLRFLFLVRRRLLKYSHQNLVHQTSLSCQIRRRCRWIPQETMWWRT